MQVRFIPDVSVRTAVLVAAFILTGGLACTYEAPVQGSPDAGGEPNGDFDAGAQLEEKDAGGELPDAGDVTERGFGVGGMFRLVDHPLADEGRLNGWVDVFEPDFQRIAGATVTVNGVLVPEDSPRNYKLSNLPIEANPGEALAIHATKDAQSATTEVPCPGPVHITSHSEGQAVVPGETLTVTWEGNIYRNPSFYPELSLRGYDASSNTYTQDRKVESIKGMAESAQIVVPETAAGGYLLGIKVWGESSYPNGYHVQCDYEARIQLTKK